MQHLHILGISGTFMSALAILAREAGYEVTGSDAQCYPPVSDLLSAKGIQWTEGYEDSRQALAADVVIIGNVIKRGMPVLEAVLDAGKPYFSGPQWLADHLLGRYQVLAVAGTHGKTTTTCMLAWILDQAGLAPGFLIGGVSANFQTSARLGVGNYFVIEADEYDSAYFDKRPKFMHYKPQVAILNNLEFDHADIYPDLAAIQQQFHYLLKTIPSQGLAILPRDDQALQTVLAKGQYSEIQTLAWTGDADWCAELLHEAGSRFVVYFKGERVAEVNWSLLGRFNVENALAAMAAACKAGVHPEQAALALASFIPVKRRLEVRGEKAGVTVYDDFAHHPTAIERTLQALKQSRRHQRILVVIEFASYTMRTGVHREAIGQALAKADCAYILNPKDFSLDTTRLLCPFNLLDNTDAIIQAVKADARPGDAILVMSNRGFDNIHQRLLSVL